jgi:CHAT domain-containing protein
MKADDVERSALLKEHSALADLELARVLKDICYDAWQTEPARSVQAAAAVNVLATQTQDKEVMALAQWVAGIASLVEGQMEKAIEHLDAAEASLLSLRNKHAAAATQVSKLIALAMLGRYDEAIACGLRARDVTINCDDILTTGKIEHNIGNIYFRRDQYSEAETFQNSARERFLQLNDQIQLTKIENSLALTLSHQHRIRDAEQLYQQALERARASDQIAVQAAIESSIGMLALFEGRYDRALDYLERSRRKYVLLQMPHLSAMTEQEIADTYLELNLAPEAAEIYNRVGRTFADLGMRAEEARSLAYYGRALIIFGENDKARSLLEKARELYKKEGNVVGAALVQLTEAQLFYARQDYSAASRSVAEVEPALIAAGAPRHLLYARWLRGETLRASGSSDEARAELSQTLAQAELEEQDDLTARCLTSLGLLDQAARDHVAAERSFKRAITLIEQLRAPLPAEEFRAAYFSDKLVPYHELVRLCLEGGDHREAEALSFAESARARALADTFAGDLKLTHPRDEFERTHFQQIEDLRKQLNYLYNQLNRSVEAQSRTSTEIARLNQAQRDCERRLGEMIRQLQHRGIGLRGHIEPFDVQELQHALDDRVALVEYIVIDRELIAFVVTNSSVRVIRNLTTEADLAKEVAQFRFQIDALRFGSGAIRNRLPILTERTNRHLASLYEKLLRPIEHAIDDRKLIIVPHGALHYLPFHALYDGANFAIEKREVGYAPSAQVFLQCLKRPRKSLNSALLMGVSDEQNAHVRNEVESLSEIFPGSLSFLNAKATIEVLRDSSAAVDVLHLACHAHFRSDNPLFSSLRLGDGAFTVRDAYLLRLNCELVSLSACETGVNAIAPGEEIIGLARGFLSAGAPSLLMSLWTVDDEATAALMSDFYRYLREMRSPSKALRRAQLKSLRDRSHPFFWSPFILVGR